MSAHPDAYARLARDLSRTKDRKIHDELLDQWLDYRYLASEWDGEQWGFDPETWMEKERAELLSRAMPSNSSPGSRRLDRGVS